MNTVAADAQIQAFREQFQQVRDEISRVIVGNEEIISGVMTCLLARGHVLLEGIPGVGKTKLVQTPAGGSFAAHGVGNLPEEITFARWHSPKAHLYPLVSQLDSRQAIKVTDRQHIEAPSLDLVEPTGIEPATFSLRTRRSTN